MDGERWSRSNRSIRCCCLKPTGAWSSHTKRIFPSTALCCTYSSRRQWLARAPMLSRLHSASPNESPRSYRRIVDLNSRLGSADRVSPHDRSALLVVSGCLVPACDGILLMDRSRSHAHGRQRGRPRRPQSPSSISSVLMHALISHGRFGN